MADQTRKPKPKKDEEQAQADEQESTDAKTEEVDELLDEIDEVLEVNSEEFVRSYVQKGVKPSSPSPSWATLKLGGCSRSASPM